MYAEQTHAAQLVAEFTRQKLSAAKWDRERAKARKPGRAGIRSEKTLLLVAIGDGQLRAGVIESQRRLGHHGPLVGRRKIGLLTRGGAVAAYAFIVEVGFRCGRDPNGELARFARWVRCEAGDLLLGARILLVGADGIGREADAFFPDQKRLGFLLMH